MSSLLSGALVFFFLVFYFIVRYNVSESETLKVTIIVSKKTKMPYDEFGVFTNSTADNNSDIVGCDDDGGIGQLTFYTFRFKDYKFDEA